jgi:hypothetical protein
MQRNLMFWALVVALVVAGALPAAANIINVANVTEDCSGFTITVSGTHLSKPTTVNFTITLTPTSGPPIVITDSIPVAPIPHTHGNWSATYTQTWAHYGVTLAGKYTLTGTATLVEPKNPKYDTIKIKFSPSTLDCETAAVTCLPSSSLGVLVQGTTVTSYVPNGSWDNTASTGVQVVQLEPTTPAPTPIATPVAVNSCASNSVTGETVCSSNGTDVYLITGSTLNTTLTSDANAFAGFSGGACETCGVAINEVANKAVLTIGLTPSPSGSGLDFLDLTSNAFTPVPASTEVSEDIVVDQSRDLVLSPSENGNYDLFNTKTGGEFINAVGGTLDSAGEDCTTGIALSTIEFTSNLYLADLTQATFVPGTPGSWSDPGQQTQNFPEFGGFAAGTSGIAITPGSHLGVVTGEFCGNAFGGIQLPSTSGSGTPAVVDYAAAVLPNTPDGNVFEQGLDPHTVTAYLSPNSGDSFGLMANGCGVPPTFMAVIDLNKLLAAPRLSGTHTVDPSYDLILNGVVSYVAVQ